PQALTRPTRISLRAGHTFRRPLRLFSRESRASGRLRPQGESAPGLPERIWDGQFRHRRLRPRCRRLCGQHVGGRRGRSKNEVTSRSKRLLLENGVFQRDVVLRCFWSDQQRRFCSPQSVRFCSRAVLVLLLLLVWLLIAPRPPKLSAMRPI